MCGIVGYAGNEKATPILLNGLSKLEYRGYDSAGICICENGEIVVKKSKGRLSNLSEITGSGLKYSATVGIGHTRWAITLKEMLISKGYEFASDTDTEVVAHLLYDNYEDDVLMAIRKTLYMLKGAYALGIIFKDTPDKIYAVRKESPLIIGLSENGNFIASDVPAILEYTKEVYYPDNNEIAVIEKNGVTVLNEELKPVKKEKITVQWSVESACKGGFEHYMLKEIYEQPEAFEKTVFPRIIDDKIEFEQLSFTKEQLLDFNKVYIVACGSAYHVGVFGKYLIEKYCRIPVEVDVASEFRYRNPIVNEKTLFIAISQSGETADTLAALREAKRNGAETVSVVNVVGSSIARESNKVIYTMAGPEIAVATTKAYSSQISVMYLLCMYMGNVLGEISDTQLKEYLDTLKTLPDLMKNVLDDMPVFCDLGKKFSQNETVFFIGRGVDYALSMEGSLKLKEISYIKSEAYAAGELKHGTISLIEEGTLVIALATEKNLVEKTFSNIKEVKARGAKVFLITNEDEVVTDDIADYVYRLPKCTDIFIPSLLILPLQAIAYHIAKNRGCDIDKPRNLAKSVTVE